MKWIFFVFVIDVLPFQTPSPTPQLIPPPPTVSHKASSPYSAACYKNYPSAPTPHPLPPLPPAPAISTVSFIHPLPLNVLPPSLPLIPPQPPDSAAAVEWVSDAKYVNWDMKRIGSDKLCQVCVFHNHPVLEMCIVFREFAVIQVTSAQFTRTECEYDDDDDCFCIVLFYLHLSRFV